MIRSQRHRWLVILVVVWLGCNSATPVVDDAPFREAITRYLQSNNMALKIKEIKQGPTVDGNVAELKAAMSHEQLGGPSVTWSFQFAKQPDGSWQVTKHQG